MAYTVDQKQGFAQRLEAVKAGLKRRNIKYYAEAAKAIDDNANPKQLQNVMQGTTYNFEALALLERVAGISQPIHAEV